ncbi:MAG TPA: 30S ribosomal protein S6 [Pirellulaceae bacterium]|nr:30S ribosomal protein S6 [Pirellulaceae bacterium]HMO91905.1 30S ribosomal protein S6 [Pirellulaceae bacterium]HMP68705.1 30S ribosomal protein S6 [Pirellulaceae bacterium]
MAENNYECMMIVDANVYARDPGGVANTITGLIEKMGGTVLASRMWIEQKLSYAIRGRHKGVYWVSYFRMAPDKLGTFNRQCQLTDEILRHLTIKIDPRLIDTMVAVAKGERPRKSDAEEEAGSDEAIAETTELVES